MPQKLLTCPCECVHHARIINIIMGGQDFSFPSPSLSLSLLSTLSCTECNVRHLLFKEKL